MQDCRTCENKKWKDMYVTAQQRFDKVLMRMAVGVVLLIAVVAVCLIITVCSLIKLQNFINGFECVEETEISIEQDQRGDNTVVLPSGEEVKTNGSEIYREEESLLEKESNKINTINVYR